MDNVVKGMAAGLVASVILGILMYARQVMGLPGADPEQLMTLALYRLGFTITPATGWVAHMIIGTVIWGGLFGYMNPLIPGNSPVVNGLCFSVITWLLMVVFVMPLANIGAGTFSPAGDNTIAVTLIMHLLFGAILGAAYAVQPDIGPQRPALTD